MVDVLDKIKASLVQLSLNEPGNIGAESCFTLL